MLCQFPKQSGAVVKMIRYIFGDAAFFSVLSQLLLKHKYDTNINKRIARYHCAQNLSDMKT